MSHSLTKKTRTTSGPVSIFPEELSPIASAVTDILSFKQRDGLTDKHHSAFYNRLWTITRYFWFCSLIIGNKDFNFIAKCHNN